MTGLGSPVGSITCCGELRLSSPWFERGVGGFQAGGVSATLTFKVIFFRPERSV